MAAPDDLAAERDFCWKMESLTRLRYVLRYVHDVHVALNSYDESKREQRKTKSIVKNLKKIILILNFKKSICKYLYIICKLVFIICNSIR